MGFKLNRDLNPFYVKPTGAGAPVSNPAYDEAKRKQAEYEKSLGTDYLSTDATIKRGQIAGLGRAKEIYGQDVKATGGQVQDIIAQRKAMLEQTDPVSSSIRDSANRQIRALRANAGADQVLTSAQEAQIRRSSERDVSEALYSQKQQSLGEYQRLVGNILSGQTGIEMGFAGLEKGGQYQAPPRPSSGALGTVICTELFNQGKLPITFLLRDQAYGREVRKTRPHVYRGYIFLATPVVAKMRHSPLLSDLIAIPALAWAENMAGRKNLLGKFISMIGEPLCGLVGKVLIWSDLWKPRTDYQN